jgi:hypothetical protein
MGALSRIRLPQPISAIHTWWSSTWLVSLWAGWVGAVASVVMLKFPWARPIVPVDALLQLGLFVIWNSLVVSYCLRRKSPVRALTSSYVLSAASAWFQVPVVVVLQAWVHGFQGSLLDLFWVGFRVGWNDGVVLGIGYASFLIPLLYLVREIKEQHSYNNSEWILLIISAWSIFAGVFYGQMVDSSTSDIVPLFMAGMLGFSWTGRRLLARSYWLEQVRKGDVPGWAMRHVSETQSYSQLLPLDQRAKTKPNTVLYLVDTDRLPVGTPFRDAGHVHQTPVAVLHSPHELEKKLPVAASEIHEKTR